MSPPKLDRLRGREIFSKPSNQLSVSLQVYLFWCYTNLLLISTKLVINASDACSFKAVRFYRLAGCTLAQVRGLIGKYLLTNPFHPKDFLLTFKFWHRYRLLCSKTNCPATFCLTPRKTLFIASCC